jgi:3-oxoadipate enol-lactonase
MSGQPSEQILSVNGVNLHVTQAGQGEPLLMIHGVTVDATFAQNEIAALADKHQVIAPDLRGHGRSTRPAGFTLDDLVADMIALLDALGIERTAVLGASMGSYVAQGVALAIPHRVSKLILVVPKSNGITSSSSRVLAEHADELRGLSREQQQQWLNGQMFAPETPGDVRQQVMDWVVGRQRDGLGMSAAQLAAANDAVLGFDFRTLLPSLDIPTLVISGRHDILNPPQEGEQLAELLPDARFIVFEHSGHLLSWEEPEHYVDAVRTFLER